MIHGWLGVDMAFEEATAATCLEPSSRRIGERILALKKSSRACLVHVFGVDPKSAVVKAGINSQDRGPRER